MIAARPIMVVHLLQNKVEKQIFSFFDKIFVFITKYTLFAEKMFLYGKKSFILKKCVTEKKLFKQRKIYMKM